jgi:serine/threonine-protein kinase
LGPYRIVERVGGGGMGDVYRALDPEMYDRVVAIKVPRAEIANDRAQRRFEREIAASARLAHENIVRAYRRGAELGRPYLVMEFVVGRKLVDVIRQEQPLAARRVGRIVLGIARGLEHAEAGGVINRDIKPENILLAGPGEIPKILDYGLALIRDLDEQVTRHGVALGTPAYAAPEQFRDPHAVTIRADVYSLGCTAFCCLTGRPPFPGTDLEGLYRLHHEAPRPSVRAWRADVPGELDTLVQTMMASNVGDRPGPTDVILALELLLPTLGDQPPGEPFVSAEARIDAQCPECGQTFHLAPSLGGKPVRGPNRVCGAVWVPRPEVPPGSATTKDWPGGTGGPPPGPDAEPDFEPGIPRLLAAQPADAPASLPEVLDALPVAGDAPPPVVLEAVASVEPAGRLESPSGADVIVVPPAAVVAVPEVSPRPLQIGRAHV